ncbi:extracellular calcium-sensing receptor-like [Pelobates cultripes]|uniref:Extracellular calcium-sensing receptor-like n=1 Tax=Pelobates cultripes TaxID=61616 RepID=A0AAD1SRC3_PELCU|nr:extracellular calcium-sensing receptor-like [Pelobates cultripes]
MGLEQDRSQVPTHSKGKFPNLDMEMVLECSQEMLPCKEELGNSLKMATVMEQEAIPVSFRNKVLDQSHLKQVCSNSLTLTVWPIFWATEKLQDQRLSSIPIKDLLVKMANLFNMAPYGKELSEDLKKRIVVLHKDGLGYKKIAKTLKRSCSTVSKTIQWFHRTGSTQNRLRHGRPKKLSARPQCYIQRLSLGNRRMSAATIAAEFEWEFDRMMWLRLNFYGPNPAEKSMKFVRSLVFKTLLYRAEGDGQLPRLLDHSLELNTLVNLTQTYNNIIWRIQTQ